MTFLDVRQIAMSADTSRASRAPDTLSDGGEAAREDLGRLAGLRDECRLYPVTMRVPCSTPRSSLFGIFRCSPPSHDRALYKSWPRSRSMGSGSTPFITTGTPPVSAECRAREPDLCRLPSALAVAKTRAIRPKLADRLRRDRKNLISAGNLAIRSSPSPPVGATPLKAGGAA